MNRISKSQIRFIRSLRQKKVRDAERLFVAEGRKCIEELLHAFEPVSVCLTDADEPPAWLGGVPSGIIFSANGHETEQMSSLRTPQGAIAVFSQRQDKGAFVGTDSLVLALDGVQDPGNLGTIIRTADWFGVSDIVCSPDTADCWNAKVVQATMGSLARVRLHYRDIPNWLREQHSAYPDMPVYGTLLEGREMYQAEAIGERGHCIIIMGNEGNGITPEVRQLITHPLRIPAFPHADCTGGPESLNVATATAVTLAEFRREIHSIT